MRRCGTVIAALSELNPNVVFELGAARAMDKRLALLAQRRFVRDLPANVRSEQLLLAYSPRERGWPTAAVFRAATQVLSIDIGQEQVREASERYHRRPGDALPVVSDRSS